MDKMLKRIVLNFLFCMFLGAAFGCSTSKGISPSKPSPKLKSEKKLSRVQKTKEVKKKKRGEKKSKRKFSDANLNEDIIPKNAEVIRVRKRKKLKFSPKQPSRKRRRERSFNVKDRKRDAESQEPVTKTVKAIELFEDFLKKNQGHKDRMLIADTYLKVAELYFRQEQERYDREMKKYDEVIEKSGFKALSEAVEPPSYDYKKAIANYQHVIENFPKYNKMDAVYYGLAYSYYDQNQKDLAHTTFKKLVKLFPNSPYASESKMRIGEYYFTTNQFEEAGTVFENMLKDRENPYRNLILYKLGWTYFSEGNFQDATRTFLSIRKRKDSNEKMATISRGLFNESLRYVSRIFSGTSGLGGLVNYAKEKKKSEYLPDLVRFLGDAYKEEEEYEDARKAYSYFVKSFSKNDTLALVEHSLISLDEKRGENNEKIIEKLQSFVDKYDVSSPRFKQINDSVTKGEVLTITKIAQSKIALYNRSVHLLFTIIDEVTGLEDKKGAQKFLNSGQKDVIKNISFKNIAIIFSNSTGVEGILNYTSGKNSYRIHLPDILKAIAETYNEQNRQWQAVQAYQVLLENYPGLEDAPIIQNKIVQIYEQGDKPEEAIEQRKAFIEKFSPGSQWYSAEKINSDRRWGTIALAEKSLRRVALFYHARSQKHKKIEDIDNAVSYYQKYLEFFKDHPRNLEMTFFYAELLNEFQDPIEAVSFYEKVAWSGAKENKSEKNLKKKENKKLKKFRLDSAYAVILIYENLRKGENYFGQYTKELIKTINKFTKIFPDNERNPELLFKAGSILFKASKFEIARKFFLELIKGYPQNTMASESIRLVAQGYFEQGEYDKAEEWYVTALASKEAHDYEKNQSLKKMLASTKFKKAERLQANNKFREAGEEFLGISKVTPDRLVASIALFNAGINFKKINDCVSLFDINRQLLLKYPESQYSKGVMLSYMECEQGIKKWDRGAINIKQLALSNRSLSQLASPLFLSGYFYNQAGDEINERDTYLLFVKNFKDDPRVVEALSKAAEIDYKRKNYHSAKKYFEKSFAAYERFVSFNQKIDPYFAALAKYKIGEIKFSAFAKIKIKEPIEKTMNMKQKSMAEVLTEFTKAADFKITEWTTAATYKIGTVFEEFKRSIIEAEKPKGLSEVEIEDYEILLEEQAYPFEEKAIEAYQANLQRLYSEKLYNKWIDKTIERMAFLFPWSYKKYEKTVRRDDMYIIMDE